MVVKITKYDEAAALQAAGLPPDDVALDGETQRVVFTFRDADTARRLLADHRAGKLTAPTLATTGAFSQLKSAIFDVRRAAGLARPGRRR